MMRVTNEQAAEWEGLLGGHSIVGLTVGLFADRATYIGLIHKLVDSLKSLRDEQSGPPLIRDAARWRAAMDMTAATLAEVKAAGLLPEESR